jgi:hypothetical protein
MADRLVAPGDAMALAGAMRRALDRPGEMVARASALRNRIAAKFSVDPMVDSILAAYQQARLSSASVPSPVASRRAA